MSCCCTKHSVQPVVGRCRIIWKRNVVSTAGAYDLSKADFIVIIVTATNDVTTASEIDVRGRTD